MQITTGKTQKIKIGKSAKKPIPEKQSDLEGKCKVLQSDSQHIVLSSEEDKTMRVLALEFENLKEAIITE